MGQYAYLINRETRIKLCVSQISSSGERINRMVIDDPDKFGSFLLHCRENKLQIECVDEHWFDQNVSLETDEPFTDFNTNIFPRSGRRIYEYVDDIESNESQLLRELVELKDYKDNNGKDVYYNTTQPMLWKRAREILSSVKGVDPAICDHHFIHSSTSFKTCVHCGRIFPNKKT